MPQSAHKQITVGTHRGIPLSTTLSKIQPLLDPCEITRVANITGLDDIGIPTVVVVRPNARSLSTTQGKGLTLEAAKVSGIMESLEQYHAERIASPVALGSYRERCAVGRVIEVVRLPRYTRSWNPEARCVWISARTWPSGEPCEVPFELVHLDMRRPLPEGSGLFPLGSNGLASGNSLPEAVAHGAWELIERDSVALFYQRSLEDQARCRVRLDTVDNGDCRDLLTRYEAARVGVAVWDITSDVGIAAYFCSIVEKELDPFRLIGLARGYGCHPDRAVALCRALTEAAQSRLTRITGSRDDIQSEDFDLIRTPSAILQHQLHLAAEALASRAFQDTPSRQFATFEEDLEWTADRLREANLGSILYVRLSPDEYPVSVARVIVEGLEGAPDVPGYVPGQRATAVREET